MSRLAPFVYVACSVWAGQGNAENPMILYDQAECLRDHAEEYLAFVDGYTLVFPGFCEDELYNPTPAQVAEGTSQNSGASIAGSSIIDLTTEDPARAAQLEKLLANTKATALLVTPEMVRCLKNRFEAVSNKLTVERKLTIERDEKEYVDLAELIFDVCG